MISYLHRRPLSFLLAVVITLVGCAPLPKHDWTRPEYTVALVAVKSDDFKKMVEFTGPNCAPPSSSDSVFLRAWKSKEGAPNYQVCVRHTYAGDWKYFNSAWDSNGNRLDVTVISRNVGSCYGGACTLNEHIGINVSQGYLDRAAMSPEGMTFKIEGKAGQKIFSLPPAYVEGFLTVAR